MPKDLFPEDVLGPPDAAIFRAMFPTPVPGEKVPYSDSGATLEEIDDAWERACVQADEDRRRRRKDPTSEPER